MEKSSPSIYRDVHELLLHTLYYEWCFPCVTGKVESGFRNGNIIKEPLCIGQWENFRITVMANGVCT